MHERAGHPRPQGARLRVERAPFKLIDTGGMDFEDEDPLAGSIREQARPGSPKRRWRCSSSTPARGAPGDEEMADLLRRSPLPTIVAANKCDGVAELPLAAEFHRLGLGEPLAVSAAQGLGTGDLLDRIVELLPEGEARARGRHRPPGRDRASERRQVLARQPLPRRRPRDRLGGRGHDPRCDRHAAAGRRSQADADRHRRHAPPVQGRGLGRVLHRAALPARRRARRRRLRRLRRGRRRHRPGPAHRRAGDEGRLRDRARAQQVGSAGARRGRRERRHRPRPRARAGGREAAPAPARADRQRQDRPPRRRAC